MPVLRYFIFVGAGLLALLFAVDLVLPQQPGVQPAVVASTGDVPLIRIHSERKLPERVVLDTSQPTIVPSTVKTAAVVAPQQPQGQVSQALAELSAKTRVRETFAQFVPAEHKPGAVIARRGQAPAATSTEGEPQPVPHPKRKVARARPMPPPGRPMMLVAQQPHFGLFNTTW